MPVSVFKLLPMSPDYTVTYVSRPYPARLETSPNAATFYLHRGYLPSEARAADGALPLSKRLSEHGPNPPPQPTSSVGG